MIEPIYTDEWVSMYCGDMREIVPTIGIVDHVITDPPYSERTHTGSEETGGDGAERREIRYAHWSEIDAAEALALWHGMTRGWIVAMSCHALAATYERTAYGLGRYAFSPLTYLVPGSRIRLMGDGPAQWSVWISASRPRGEPYSKWGALPGGYVLPPGFREDKALPGGKEEWIMRELISDYSRDGELVLDPCCGAGTTLVAARDLRRRAVGVELDRSTAELAAERLRSTRGRMVQRSLL